MRSIRTSPCRLRSRSFETMGGRPRRRGGARRAPSSRRRPQDPRARRRPSRPQTACNRRLQSRPQTACNRRPQSRPQTACNRRPQNGRTRGVRGHHPVCRRSRRRWCVAARHACLRRPRRGAPLDRRDKAAANRRRVRYQEPAPPRSHGRRTNRRPEGRRPFLRRRLFGFWIRRHRQCLERVSLRP